MNTLHVGIGEHGKQLALAGQHVEALRHYREAMQQATRHAAPEVFLRHYTQCALESLERLGALDEVLGTCGRAREHYRQHPPADAVARKDQASFLEREGIVLLRLQRPDEAIACFTAAVAAVRPARAPLAETLLGWLRANLHVTPARLDRELTRQKYWSVRADSVRAEWALALPDGPAASH
jgi:tetratricopeptide (TPR) repeat protein